MARLRTLLAADADIERVLLHTLRRFSVRKYDEYARHLLLYRILDDGNLVEVLAVLYDAMDLPRHWRTRTEMP